ncbi:C-C chemokine receptor-like 2 [Phodopus roborovskii]|uniref:Ccrl2 protein n=1 Tax=Phodopus roborovskii TaxID=109678 RepID=A0AAU9YSF0_PHORO|nr:C-C chemokine receptor-like 2 [Phodopus roborovskii]CAH6777613.1 Ccrl2 [Phodopus roborovskii]
MDYSTAAPEDDYDVLIQDDLDSHEPEQALTPQLLSAQQALQFFCLVFALGLLNNALAVFILVKYKGLKNVGNIYCLNLAVSNLCFLLPLPFWAQAAASGESPGNGTCKALVGLHSTGLYSETFFNILLLVQGYKLFSQGTQSSALTTVRSVVVTSILAWITAVTLALPESVFYQPHMERQRSNCAFGKPHFLPVGEPFWKYFLTSKTNILVLGFPLVVFIFCCAQMRKTQAFRERQNDLRKLGFVIMAVFLLMWAPYNIVLFLSEFQEHLPLQDGKHSYHLDASLQVTQLIATTHCCANPLICLLFDKAFTRCLCSLFPRCSGSPSRSGADSQGAPPRRGHDQTFELYSSLHQRQDM